ncbi:MAG: hypothetical protein ACRENP_22540 [Longimicrobiales bacterium]
MTTVDVFRHIIACLDQAGIPYMLTGSFASSYHGAPRATQDIDLVVAPTPDQIRTLVAQLPRSEYYADLETALEAQRNEGQFNIIDLATGWKIDLIIRKSRAFSRQEFERREFVDFQGMRLAVATAEDIIIAKLEWAKLSESQRQIEDVAAMLRIRGQELDHDYIQNWVELLSVVEQWRAARRAARPVQ